MEISPTTTRNLTRMEACLDYARNRAGFKRVGATSEVYKHRSGLAKLTVTDPECSIQLAIYKRGAKGGYLVRTGSIDLSNIAPRMFAEVLDAVMANL